MTTNKTQPTDLSASALLGSIADPQRRADCEAIAAMMERAIGEPPVMWGTAIVGFGRYHYRYESGREGDWAMTAFSPRKGDISVYLMLPGAHQDALLARLGKHKMGKGCLYIRRLADVDVQVLEQLIIDSVAEVRRQYG